MPSVLDLLTAWMPEQRWFAGKGRTPELEIVGSFDLETGGEDVIVRTLLVRDAGGALATLYQVPVTIRATADETVQANAIGVLDDGTILADGPHDPVYARALLATIRDGIEAAPLGAAAHGVPIGAAEAGEPKHAKVLSGEQSNTSIVIETDGAPVIAKVFRALHHGDNPDVVLQSALSAAGSTRVPGCIGSLAGEWMDDTRPDGARGQLAFAQEFLPGTEDAWRVALRSAAAGEDFTDGARALGAATAEVHRMLADLFPAVPAARAEIDAVLASFESRLALAVDEVPDVAAHRDAIAAVYRRAADAAWPALQRIHGDYHLGQVLSVPDRGWVLLDFEGEPLRPMAERDQPDIPLRDVAGMLRSFDYVAGSVRLGGSATAEAVDGAERWAADAREAFLDGYSDGIGRDVRAETELLAAFELDKAAYEAVYEARNRPTWIPIPVTAIERLAGA